MSLILQMLNFVCICPKKQLRYTAREQETDLA